MKKYKQNDFDAVARYYDRLAEFVFGDELRKAQVHFLNRITTARNVLVLGGGTGWFLAELRAINTDCKIMYVESSPKMLELSKKRISDHHNIHFLHGTEHDFPQGQIFDAVVTNFYFDLFDEPTLEKVVFKICSHLEPGAVWLATDFTNSTNLKHRFLLRTMYWFFRMSSNIQAKKLPPWQDQLLQHASMPVEMKNFENGFICSSLARYKPAT